MRFQVKCVVYILLRDLIQTISMNSPPQFPTIEIKFHTEKHNFTVHFSSDSKHIKRRCLLKSARLLILGPHTAAGWGGGGIDEGDGTMVATDGAKDPEVSTAEAAIVGEGIACKCYIVENEFDNVTKKETMEANNYLIIFHTYFSSSTDAGIGSCSTLSPVDIVAQQGVVVGGLVHHGEADQCPGKV